MRVENENLEEIKEEIKEAKTAEKKSVRKESTWECVFSDRVDFIIKKHMAKITKTLVFLFSRKTFYILTEPGEKIERVNRTTLGTFFTGINKNPFSICLKNGDFLRFEPTYTMDTKETLCNMISIAEGKPFTVKYEDRELNIEPGEDDYNLILSEVVLMGEYVGLCLNGTVKDTITPVYRRSRKICLYLKNKRQAIGNLYWTGNELFWNNFREIFEIFGFDNTKTIIDAPFVFKTMTTSYMRQISAKDAVPVLKMANVDLSRLAEYVVTDLYPKQLSNLADYIDTLSMEMDLYGKVKEKYPKNINVRHRVLARAVNERNNCSQYSEAFKDTVGNLEEDYSYIGGDYLIRIPEDPQELINEGTELGHCVAEYIPKVATGDCLVAFLRRRKEPDKPLFTIEIIGSRITQVEGYQRNINLPRDMYNFLERFAKEKGLEITAPLNVPEKEEEKEKEEEAPRYPHLVMLYPSEERSE